MSNIIINSFDGNKYTSLLPNANQALFSDKANKAHEADLLDSYRASSFLLKTESVSLANLKVWCNTLDSNSFVLDDISYVNCEEINFPYPKLYWCSQILPRTGIIGQPNSVTTTKCYITSQITSNGTYSFDGKTYLVNSANDLTLNAYNLISNNNNNFLTQIVLIETAKSFPVYIYSSSCTIERSSASRINYSIYGTKASTHQRNYAVTESQQTTNKWITPSEYYSISKSLLGEITGVAI